MLVVQCACDQPAAIPPLRAGLRTLLKHALEDHLARFVGPEPTALVFTGEKCAPICRQNSSRTFGRARAAVGRPGVHFHDLRHFAGTMAARTGATTRDLMARLGQSSPRAALIYQHATAERDHAIAEGLDAIIEANQATRGAPIVELLPRQASLASSRPPERGAADPAS